MVKLSNLIPVSRWYPQLEDYPLIIAGPCSAESYEQLLNTAIAISDIKKVKVLRAGLWKPRTHPDSFEGVGEKGLKWLQQIRKQTGLLTTVEITTAKGIELAVEYEVDILWVGARSVANPVNIQALSDAMKGIDKPVMIKNPVHPDLEHWIGAIERFFNAGVRKMAAVHRGFYPFEKTRLRNVPKWEFPIELKRRYPGLPVICDPSHIAGDTKLVSEIAQKAMNLHLDGLMIETHIDPPSALSDAKQQLTPEGLKRLLDNLNTGKLVNGSDAGEELENFREQLDSIDQQMLELMAQRMQIVDEIGQYKSDNNISVFQLRRWQKTFKNNNSLGKKLGLNSDFIRKITSLIHLQSIARQHEVMERRREEDKKTRTKSNNKKTGGY